MRGLNRQAKDREIKTLKKKFGEWGLAPNATIQLTDETLEAIISDVDGSAPLVEWAEKLGYVLKALQLSTSQIRNIFGTVRQIEMDWEGQALAEEEREDAVRQAAKRLGLLRPKLAYQAGRQQGKGKEGVQALADVLTPAISLVGQDPNRFQNFVSFFEAILAYHTAAGGQQ
ncbi:MAG TPA: type III-A CRISPR-associated protein Csm2 [Anaerolineae bacterium]|nr:type III-A CRISPR-associated protein Csm2 [Anaerolineae bacterium]